MARVVLRLALCIVGAGDTDDVETITTVAKALWPHWSWLAIGEHRDGVCILAQNAGKNITVNKAITDLKTKLPNHLHDMRVFTAQSDELCTNGDFIAEFGTFSRAGKRKSTFVRTYVDEDNITDPNHPSVLNKREIALQAADFTIGTILDNITDQIYKKDHEQNVDHVEDRFQCQECAIYFDSIFGY
jgi:hypothetical protein